MISTAVFVLHVRVGYADRELCIYEMMRRRNISFTFVLDGDVSDLTDSVLDKYFVGCMHQRNATTSCAMKHIIACENIVDRNLDGALVLEDNVMLYDNFENVYEACMSELKSRNLERAIISFEDSALKFVPRSERKSGQYLYKKNSDRFAGALYYSYDAAKMIVDYVASYHCNLPIALLHTELTRMSMLNYYWCHPCIATQGFHACAFDTCTNMRSVKKFFCRGMTWKLKLYCKKFLCWLR